MSVLTGVRVVALAVGIGTLATATSVSAQTVHVKPGDHLFKLDTSGRRSDGVVRALSASSLTVVAEGREQQWTLDDTAALWREGDSLRNGTIVGAAAGLGIGILGGLGLASIAESDDPSSSAFAIGALGAAGGAGLGAWLDSLHRGRTLVYERRPGVVIGPVLSRAARGAQIAWRF